MVNSTLVFKNCLLPRFDKIVLNYRTDHPRKFFNTKLTPQLHYGKRANTQLSTYLYVTLKKRLVTNVMRLAAPPTTMIFSHTPLTALLFPGYFVFVLIFKVLYYFTKINWWKKPEQYPKTVIF